jgi:hypothetical protein
MDLPYHRSLHRLLLRQRSSSARLSCSHYLELASSGASLPINMSSREYVRLFDTTRPSSLSSSHFIEYAITLAAPRFLINA